MAQKIDIDNKDKQKRPAKKLSEYGTQLQEKQRVKQMYGMRERQFRRFFETAVRNVGAPGENLLTLLESRLDNVVYRLKMATTRPQSRQMIVHGHVVVNGVKVYSPSFLVKVSDVVTLDPKMLDHKIFMEQVVEKRVKLGIKVPDWLELDKKSLVGKILRKPVRADLQVPIEDHLIVELYSK